MRCALGLLALVGFLLVGCAEPPPPTPPGIPSNLSPPNPGQPPTGGGGAGGAPAPGGATPGGASPTPGGSGAAPDGKEIPDRNVEITPENASITFVGTHAAPKAKDPRTGTFEKFSGTAVVDFNTKSFKSVSVEIDLTEIKTFNPMLTNHLKSPDFFDVEQYPTAKFESTKIEVGESGAHTITGNLTLHGQTKEINFPAHVDSSNYGMNFKAEFTIDRMDFGVGDSDAGKGVERPVALTVTIGKPTSPN
jgi:polyisoprenoid-binding protein YceI